MILPQQDFIYDQHQTVVPFGIYDDLIKNVDTSSVDKQGFVAKKRRTERRL